jgi:hypothetical protein
MNKWHLIKKYIFPLYSSASFSYCFVTINYRQKRVMDTTNRRLSLPDLAKLKEEWDRREAIQATAQLLPGKLQVRAFFSSKNYRDTNTVR